MYLVSDGFLRAVKNNTRKYYWTGTIVTEGGMTYEFGTKETVKGSRYIARQCCGSTEIELGTAYDFIALCCKGDPSGMGIYPWICGSAV